MVNHFFGMMRANFYLFDLTTIKFIELQNFGKPNLGRYDFLGVCCRFHFYPVYKWLL